MSQAYMWPVLATAPDMPHLPSLVTQTVGATYEEAVAEVEAVSQDPENIWFGWSMIVGPFHN